MTHNDAIDNTSVLESEHPRFLSRPRAFALGYLLALTLAEAITVLVDPRAGLILHGLILLAVMLLSAISHQKRELRFLLPLALPPIIRLLSLALPLTNFPLIYWYAVIGVPLFIATFLTVRATGLTAEMIGLRIRWRDLPVQLLIGLSGMLFGFIEYLILRPEPLVSEPSWEMVLLIALILLVFTGFLEELIFRGVLQASSTQELGHLGVVFVALVFSVLHLGYRSGLDVIFVFAVAITFGVLVQRFRNLLGVSIAHGLINVSLYLIFPFLLTAP
jgi:membrane protease YdiL (CAAX protease family)